MPRFLSFFVAVAAPLLMAMSCTVPAATVQSSDALCAALGPKTWKPVEGCRDGNFYKSRTDGKWYYCYNVGQSALLAGPGVSDCFRDPTNQVSDQWAAILDQWAAGNTSGSSTPGVSDPVLTDTPSSTPPPTTTTFD